MQLYNLPLNPSTAVIQTLYGNFTHPKAQEIVLLKTKSIELYSVSEQYISIHIGDSYSSFSLRNFSAFSEPPLLLGTME